jgi:hypothetical protein
MVIPSLETLALDTTIGITEYLPDELRDRIAETTRNKLREQVRRDEFTSWWNQIEAILLRKFTEQCIEDYNSPEMNTFSEEIDGDGRNMTETKSFFESFEFVRDVDRLVYTLLSMNPFPARKAKRQRCFSEDTDDDDSKSIDYASTPSSESDTWN